MYTYNHIYHNNNEVKAFLRQLRLRISVSDSILIRIHSGIHTKDEMTSLVGVIEEVIPDANIIGCSAKYIIIDGEIQERKCLISVSIFDSASTFTGRISCKNNDGSFCTGEELGKKLLMEIPNDDNTGFMLVFFPYAYSRIDAVIETINISGRHIKMMGGTAVLENEAGEIPDDLPYVIEGGCASTYDMVYSYTRDEKLIGNGDYACGIEGVGTKLPIKTDGNIVREVGGFSAVEWYTNLVGEEKLAENPNVADAFPLVMQDGKELAYYVGYMTDKATREHYLQTYPELKNGSMVSVGFFNPQKIYEQVSGLIERLSKLPAESIYIYDCHARAGLLSNCANWEIGNFKSTNASGALLSGEIITHGEKIFYANYTFVVVTLSEDPVIFTSIRSPEISSINMLQEENVHTLSYLLSNSNKMLNEELELQRTLVENAMFFNQALGIDNSIKYQYDINIVGLNKAALFYLENEKMIKLLSGISSTYTFLSEYYQRIKNKFLDKAFHVYSYNDASLIIAATEEIDETTFESIVDDIWVFLNSVMYEEVQLSYTAVTYCGMDDTIEGIEIALDYAHKQKKARVQFEELEKELKNENRKHHILWILREALKHKRIMPYYQEIHSNVPGKPKLYEALMRITDASGKIYFPDQFLPIAKEFVLYDSISELMVGHVMDCFKNLDCRVSINLSVQDIYNRKLLKMIYGKMEESTNPGKYVFELVETEEVDDYEFIKTFSEKIHELGGEIAIDDFGSGYSNLLHLFSLDADYIKIDGELIKSIHNNPRCRALIEYMQGWCEKNNIALVCEYVENKSIQDIMEEINVAYSQGYYFSKPQPWDVSKI